jgi:hypothetical protein
MKILLDECVTKRLRQHLPEHEVLTVSQMKWNGFRNGQLMAKAAAEQFDLLLTIDKNLRFQQNINKQDLIVVVIDSPSSKLEDILTLLPQFFIQLQTFEKRKAYIISQ